MSSRSPGTYLLALLAGLVAAGLGWFSTALASIFVMDLAGIPEQDGGRAMFAFFGIGLIGALAGFVLGASLLLYLRRR